MKTVLVTGASGFMGGHVLRHLALNTDWNVVAVASFEHKGRLSRMRSQVKGTRLEGNTPVVLCDLAGESAAGDLQQWIGDIKIDYIFNIASESHVDRSITHPAPFIRNNVNLMLNMLEFARIVQPKKFIHISTDEVYGPADKGHDHREGEPHRPSNPYSASKAAQESIAYSYWRTYNVPVIITNTMNIIGETQDAEKFVPLVIRKVLLGETLTIHGSKDGKPGSRFYLHARNQADALLHIAKTQSPIQYPAKDLLRFNIVGEREVDNLTMAELIAHYVGKPLNYDIVDFHSSRPGHDLRYALDGKKIKKTGWIAPVPFEESLQQTVEWYLNNREWLGL